MKRQHPTDPNLFWCPKCKGYKLRIEFYSNKHKKNGIGGWCRSCMYNSINKEKKAECNRIWRIKNLEQINERVSIYRINNQEQIRRKSAIYKKSHRKMIRKKEKKDRIDLNDSYLKHILRLTGPEITPETIKLKRHQIIMKRTLKQFKKWRQENESNCADVSGK